MHNNRLSGQLVEEIADALHDDDYSDAMGLDVFVYGEQQQRGVEAAMRKAGLRIYRRRDTSDGRTIMKGYGGALAPAVTVYFMR